MGIYLSRCIIKVQTGLKPSAHLLCSVDVSRFHLAYDSLTCVAHAVCVKIPSSICFSYLCCMCHTLNASLTCTTCVKYPVEIITAETILWHVQLTLDVRV